MENTFCAQLVKTGNLRKLQNTYPSNIALDGRGGVIGRAFGITNPPLEYKQTLKMQGKERIQNVNIYDTATTISKYVAGGVLLGATRYQMLKNRRTRHKRERLNKCFKLVKTNQEGFNKLSKYIVKPEIVAKDDSYLESLKTLIVKYKPEIRIREDRDEIVQEKGFPKIKKKEHIDLIDADIIELYDSEDIKEAIQKLNNNPYIDYVEPPLKVTTQPYIEEVKPNVDTSAENLKLNPYYTNFGEGIYYHIRDAVKRDINYLEGYKYMLVRKDYLLGSSQVTVGIMDTGIKRDHVLLKDSIDLKNSLDFVGGDGGDECGHGTHVAGTVAAIPKYIKGQYRLTYLGVAPGVKLASLRVLDKNGTGTTYGIMDAIEWVKNNGNIHIVNMSIGGPYSEALNDAIRNCKDTLFIVAAGNENQPSLNCSPASCDAPNVVTVGSFDGATGKKSNFSNYGYPTAVAAPGRNITSSWIGASDELKTISGTSMAVPHVTGIAALLKSKYPELTAAEMATIIKSGSVPDIHTGWAWLTNGKVDLAKILNKESASQKFIAKKPKAIKKLKSIKRPNIREEASVIKKVRNFINRFLRFRWS